MSASIVLPFMVLADGKAENFDVEVAAVLLLAEAKRRKGFLSSERRLEFVSKLFYPLWAVPFEDRSLILDGLNIFSLSLNFQTLPDVTSFVEDVEKGISMRGYFWDILEKHRKTFLTFTGSYEVKLSGLIKNRQLLYEMLEYIKEVASSGAKEVVSLVLVPPRLDFSLASENAAKFFALYRQVRSDIKALQHCQKILGDAAEFHEKMILKEIEFTRAFYDGEISRIKPLVEDRVNELQEELDAEIARLKKLLEREIKPKERQKESFERKLQQLEVKRAEIEEKLAVVRRRGGASWTRMERNLRLCEEKIRKFRGKLDSLNSAIDRARKHGESEIEKLRKKYAGLIEEEKHKIRDFEAQREEKILQKQKEIEKLRIAVSQISGQIKGLLDARKELIDRLDELFIPWRGEKVSLACLPFYIVGYRVGSKTETQIFQPIKVMSSGRAGILRKKIFGFSTTSKLRPYLQPRSKTLGEFLGSIERAINSDKVFKEALYRAAFSNNFLVQRGIKGAVVRGLEELESRGWIGHEEVNAIINSYFKGA